MKKRQSMKRRSTINAKKIRSGKSNIDVFVITAWTPVSDQEIRDFEELSLHSFLRYFYRLTEGVKKANTFAAVKKTALRLFLRLMPCSYSSTVQQNGNMATYHQCLVSALRPQRNGCCSDLGCMSTKLVLYEKRYSKFSTRINSLSQGMTANS